METERLLLDTCATIWLLEGKQIQADAREMIDRTAQSQAVHVSPITAWEVGMLADRERITLSTSVMGWFDRVCSLPGVVLAGMPPKVLIDSTSLPGNRPRDPADRILAATAREYDFTLVTRDRQLLAYADAGHLRAVPC